MFAKNTSLLLIFNLFCIIVTSKGNNTTWKFGLGKTYKKNRNFHSDEESKSKSDIIAIFPLRLIKIALKKSCFYSVLFLL